LENADRLVVRYSLFVVRPRILVNQQPMTKNQQLKINN